VLEQCSPAFGPPKKFDEFAS